jgi:adenine-specific DNA-methyltransferase
MALALAAGLDDVPRLAFARSFCVSLIRACWFEGQRKHRQAWPLPDATFPFSGAAPDEPAASLAGAMGKAAGQLHPISASYLIGVTYTALLPDETRSRLGVYYTPPGLARRLLDMASAAGVDWGSCRAMDPACGGGAFLAPVVSRIAAENRKFSAREIVRSIGARVRGQEIDPFAAWTSQVFLEMAVMDLCREAGERLPVVVDIRNSLLAEAGESDFDLVVGNPPYGRVTLSADVRERYRRSLYGHANLYGLFTDLAIRLTRPGGVIAYVTPTSFLAGEYFKSLRALLAVDAPPSNFDFVSVRQGVFDGVLQETLLATYKRGDRPATATVHFITPVDHERIEVTGRGNFALPSRPGSPWLIPRTAEQEQLIAFMRRMPHRLKDYGYEVSTGPLVWNRHKSQLQGRPGMGRLPLIWAECVTSEGTFVFRADKKNHEPYFKPADGDEWLISRSPCILLQRTTAKEQHRRLIAAELPKKFLSEHGAVVIENHLNMIRPVNGAPQVSPRVLAAFLNTEIVDKAFRCFSGSVAVSAYELEALPLPPPEALDSVAELIKKGSGQAAIDRACARLFATGQGA